MRRRMSHDFFFFSFIHELTEKVKSISFNENLTKTMLAVYAKLERRMRINCHQMELRLVMASEDTVNIKASTILFLFRKHCRKLPVPVSERWRSPKYSHLKKTGKRYFSQWKMSPLPSPRCLLPTPSSSYGIKGQEKPQASTSSTGSRGRYDASRLAGDA